MISFLEPEAWHLSRRMSARPFGPFKNIDGTMSNPLVAVSKCARDMIQFLQGNSLLQVAQRFAVEALGLCAQHATTNCFEKAATESFAMVAPRAAAMISDLTAAILAKVLAATRTDCALAMSHLADLPVTQGFQAFQVAVSGAKKQYSKLLDLARVGTGFAVLWSERTFLAECKQLMVNAEWWKTLTRFNVSFDRRSFEQDTVAHVTSLLQSLMIASNLDLNLTISFAKTFHVSGDAPVLIFVSLLLGEDLTAKQRQRIIDTCNKVEDKKKLVAFLFSDCLLALDSRDYDRLALVMTIILHTPEADSGTLLFCRNGLLLLDVLRSYTPIAPQLAVTAPPASGIRAYPPPPESICAARLPFHPLVHADPWIVLKEEITVETFAQLLPLSGILGVPSDNFCVAAVEKVVHDQDLHNVTFASIQNVLKSISSPETAIMAAKLVADRAPLGSDRVAALAAAYELAQSWQASLGEDAAEAVRIKVSLIEAKLRDAYDRAATEHDLTSAGVHDPEVLALVVSPADLIVKLYERYAVCSDWKGDTAKLIALTEVVAQRFGLSVQKLRSKAIFTWLLADNPEEADAPASRSAPVAMSLTGLLDDDQATAVVVSKNSVCAWDWDIKLQRVIALLRHENPELTAPNLIKCSVGDAFPQGQWRSRLRASLVLFSVVPLPNVSARLTQPLCEARERVVALCYICRLYELSIRQTVEEFLASNKEGLARGLWRSHSQRASAVRLACELCLDYDIDDLELWDSVLQRLLALNEISFLLYVLPVVSARSHLWAIPSLAAVWHKALAKAVTDGIAPVSTLVDRFLQSPFVIQSDYTMLLSAFESQHRFAAAAMCASIAGKGLPAAAIAGSPAKLLDECKSSAFLLSEKICLLVFEHIDVTKTYASIWDSQHFEQFCQYLVRRDRVSNLVSALAREARWEQAAAVIETLLSGRVDDIATALLSLAGSKEEFVHAFLKGDAERIASNSTNTP
jgi:hypothetical protein